MSDKFADLPEVRRRGLETMEEVYGFEMSDGSGDFFRYTADHLFADIWNRPGLSTRDRRLLLIGMLAGKGYADVLGIQVPAAHANGELDSAGTPSTRSVAPRAKRSAESLPPSTKNEPSTPCGRPTRPTVTSSSLTFLGRRPRSPAPPGGSERRPGT